ncbi:esterase-like activity of phytase family protein [Variovorax sp. J22R24]|nr:esterase-like activity of phytase family protein [Variovorax sp. J22R24]MDM0110455.1 esterase-like activity of phytase family protein [Variovorax sp. J22R24]
MAWLLFNIRAGNAKAQYAYRMEGSSQGRGISALVAIDDTEFLVLKRNNRGLGVDAEGSPLNKNVFRNSGIDLDVPGAVLTPVAKENATPSLDLASPTTLAHPSLVALSGCFARETGRPHNRPAAEGR